MYYKPVGTLEELFDEIKQANEQTYDDDCVTYLKYLSDKYYFDMHGRYPIGDLFYDQDNNICVIEKKSVVNFLATWNDYLRPNIVNDMIVYKRFFDFNEQETLNIFKNIYEMLPHIKITHPIIYRFLLNGFNYAFHGYISKQLTTNEYIIQLSREMSSIIELEKY